MSNLKETSLHCIDLFSGCGGLSLGLEQAGFKPLLFSEINDSAAKTYKINRSKNIIQIGDIYDYKDSHIDEHLSSWSSSGIKEIDLVSGGPPCQGYSAIGHRRVFTGIAKVDMPSNHLYEEMVRVVKKVNPKVFLFENVRGLLNARWNPTGNKGEIFDDIRKKFASLNNYVIRWDLILAKDYGVPQNRPRIIMVGIREDVLPPHLKNLSKYKCPDEPLGVIDGFIPKPCGNPPSLYDVLSDLIDPEYTKTFETKNYISDPLNEIQKLFRTRKDGSLMNKGDLFTEQVYSKHADKVVEKYAYMIANNGEISPLHKTKKFAIRVLPKTWGKSGPNITVASLPEDFVHFSQPRSLTVREMARIQTFPDWYLFVGPRMTGGRRRAGDPSIGVWDREVPKYTQIGNAVPCLLGKVIGLHLAKLLNFNDD